MNADVEIDLDQITQLISQNKAPDEIRETLEIKKTKFKEIMRMLPVRYDPEHERWVRRMDTQGYFKWKSVEQSENVIYKFPNAPSEYMLHRFEIPAIYRWLIYDNELTRIESMYIGQTVNFIQRLKVYLYGDQRISKILHQKSKDNRFSVLLQISSMSNRSLFDETFVPLIDMKNQCDRMYFESKMMAYYESQGYELLNIQKGIFY